MNKKVYLNFLYVFFDHMNDLVYFTDNQIKNKIKSHFSENDIEYVFHSLLEKHIIKTYFWDANDTHYDIDNNILKKEISKLEREIKLNQIL